MINILYTEIAKTRKTPIYVLILFVCLFISGIVFLACSIDVHFSVVIGKNPWGKITIACLGVFAIFIIVPFTFLLTSSLQYIEHRANSMKYLYTMPVSRLVFYFSKLITTLFLIILTCVSLFLMVIATGYIVNFFYPEYGLIYYNPFNLEWIGEFVHIFLGLLGVIGIHHFLSYQFKNFILPFGIGIVGFITGLLIATTNKSLCLYMPYGYPMIVKDRKMFLNEWSKPLFEDSWFTNIELYSLLVFISFVLLGAVIELRKNISH